MTEKLERYKAHGIESIILTVRKQKVILDADLARLYGVPTKRLNEQIRRNPERFPPDFAFLLTEQEVTDLKSQIATSRIKKGETLMNLSPAQHQEWTPSRKPSG